VRLRRALRRARAATLKFLVYRDLRLGVGYVEGAAAAALQVPTVGLALVARDACQEHARRARVLWASGAPGLWCDVETRARAAARCWERVAVLAREVPPLDCSPGVAPAVLASLGRLDLAEEIEDRKDRENGLLHLGRRAGVC